MSSSPRATRWLVCLLPLALMWSTAPGHLFADADGEAQKQARGGQGERPVGAARDAEGVRVEFYRAGWIPAVPQVPEGAWNASPATRVAQMHAGRFWGDKGQPAPSLTLAPPFGPEMRSGNYYSRHLPTLMVAVLLHGDPDPTIYSLRLLEPPPMRQVRGALGGDRRLVELPGEADTALLMRFFRLPVTLDHRFAETLELEFDLPAGPWRDVAEVDLDSGFPIQVQEGLRIETLERIEPDPQRPHAEPPQLLGQLRLRWSGLDADRYVMRLHGTANGREVRKSQAARHQGGTGWAAFDVRAEDDLRVTVKLRPIIAQRITIPIEPIREPDDRLYAVQPVELEGRGRFGDPVEIDLDVFDEDRMALLDLDEPRVLRSPSAEFNYIHLGAFIEQHGVDAIYYDWSNHFPPWLWSIHTSFVMTDGDVFNDADPETVAGKLASTDTAVKLAAAPEQSDGKAYIYLTRRGTIGLLRIVEAIDGDEDHPARLRLEVRILEKDAQGS